MKHLFTLLLFTVALFFPLWLSAQTALSGRHALALSASPEFSWLVGYRHSLLDKRVVRPGYRVGASYAYRLSARWWLRAGFSYAHLRYKEKLDLSKAVFEDSLLSGGPSQDPFSQKKVVYSYPEHRFVSLPVAVRFSWNGHWYAETEASANLILDQPANDVTVLPGVGIAMGYQRIIGSKGHLFLQPALRWIVNNTLPRALRSFSVHPLSLGMEVGFRQAL